MSKVDFIAAYSLFNYKCANNPKCKAKHTPPSTTSTPPSCPSTTTNDRTLWAASRPWATMKVSGSSSTTPTSPKTQWRKTIRRCTGRPATPRHCSTRTADPTSKRPMISSYLSSYLERTRFIRRHGRTQVLWLGLLLPCGVVQEVGLADAGHDPHTGRHHRRQLHGGRHEQLHFLLFHLPHQDYCGYVWTYEANYSGNAGTTLTPYDTLLVAGLPAINFLGLLIFALIWKVHKRRAVNLQ